MDHIDFKLAASVIGCLLLLTACFDKRADAGLTGPDKVVSIIMSGPNSLEPVFISEIKIDQSDRAELSVENINGKLPNVIVSAPNGSFIEIATDLANFRQFKSRIRSHCGGISDSGTVTVQWRYASGIAGSYSVQPGCSQAHEARFLHVARSIPKRLGLESFIMRGATAL